MKIQLLLNKDGFLGGVITHYARKSPFCYKEVNIPDNDVKIFMQSIIARDGVEIVESGNGYDAKFGGLKLKFNDSQDEQLLKKAKNAHKLTAKNSKRYHGDIFHEEIFEL